MPDGPTEPFGRWLRTRVGVLALIAAAAIVAWVVLRQCPGGACDPETTGYLVRPVLPLVLIGVVTLLGERRSRMRERGRTRPDDEDQPHGPQRP
jgi:hypothetical protein